VRPYPHALLAHDGIAASMPRLRCSQQRIDRVNSLDRVAVSVSRYS